MIQYSKALLVGLFISTACRSASTPASEPVLHPAAPVTTAPADTRAIYRWSIPLATGTHTYASVSQTIIQKNHDQMARRDTIEISIWFTVATNNQADSILFRGSIDSVRKKSSSQTISQGIPFTLSIKSGQIRFQNQYSKASNYSCGNTSAEPLSDILSILITRPTDFSSNSTWTDSSTTTLCSDGFPLNSQKIRSYRVTGEETQNGAPVLQLHTLETSTFSGGGAQNQHQIAITGEGQTTSQISIDLLSGIPTRSISKQTASISVTGSGQTSQFIQQVTQNVILIR